MKMPIIEHPGLAHSPGQKIIDGVVTLAFWVFWFYLWLPLLALLAWTLGFQQAYQYMIVLDGLGEMIRLLTVYGMVIGLMGGTLIAWAVYNILRFGGVERRTPRPPVTAAEIARDYGFHPAVVQRWQKARILRVSHDRNGRIDTVEIPAPGASTRL